MGKSNKNKSSAPVPSKPTTLAANEANLKQTSADKNQQSAEQTINKPAAVAPLSPQTDGEQTSLGATQLEEKQAKTSRSQIDKPQVDLASSSIKNELASNGKPNTSGESNKEAKDAGEKSNQQVRSSVDTGPITGAKSSVAASDGNNQQVCRICAKEARNRCGGCNNVSYCSKEHQKQDWKQGHKDACRAWKVCTSPELGRHLIATRAIKPGEVIVQEEPLLLTPPKVTAPVCLSCYQELFLPSEESSSADDEEIRPSQCPEKCGWPLCSSDNCRQKSEHVAECSASKDRGGVTIRHFGQEHPMYGVIGILRALRSKQENPSDYEKLMTLQHDKPAGAEETGETPFTDMSQLVMLVQKFFQLEKKGVTEETIRKISGIIDLNGHEIPIPGNYGQINRRLIGVYHTASFLEHSCCPNSTKSFSARSIVIRASVPINKGDHISISYVDPLWGGGTNDRQHFLQMTKFFTCKCKRCVDPTELDCYISAVRCQQIKCTTQAEVEEKTRVPVNKRSGMVVPVDPLDPESRWRCLTCQEEYPVKYAASIASNVANEIEKLQEAKNDASICEAFLKKFARLLPPFHFFFLEVKVDLAQLYGRTPDEPLPALAPTKLLRKQVLCEELLQALNIISPGLNRLRALILYELQAAVGTLSGIKYNVGEISAEMHFKDLLKCHSQLTEVVKVLSWEPFLSVEYRRCEGAKRELADLSAQLESYTESTKELKTPSLHLTGDTKKAESLFPVAAGKEKIDQLAAQAGLDDDDLELF